MHQKSDIDRLALGAHEMRPYDRTGDVKHACPNCPSPLTAPGALVLAPNTFCPWCYGTGLVDEATLAHYQRRIWADALAGA